MSISFKRCNLYYISATPYRLQSMIGLMMLLVLFILSGCSSTDSSASHPAEHDMHSMSSESDSGHMMSHGDVSAVSVEGSTSTRPDDVTTEPKILIGKEITLTAQYGHLEIEKGKYLPVWTYNGSVPGPQIEVTQGDTVTVHLKNQLDVPVSIHFHGVVLPNNMDGVPGVTQDAVQPGETFTYRFIAKHAGTYWYHSHQDSLNQIGRGLYGTFVVHPQKQVPVDVDRTLVLDEWSDPHTKSIDSEANTAALSSNMGMYNLYTINGHSGSHITPVTAAPGDHVRLRFVNAGNMTQLMYLPFSSYKVTATDGQDIHQPQSLSKGLLRIAPGERYDVEFTAKQSGIHLIGAVGDSTFAQSMHVPIIIEDSAQPFTEEQIADKVKQIQQSMSASDLTKWPEFDLMNYGQAAASEFDSIQKYDRTYDLKLNMGVSNGKMAYTVNDKAYPDMDKIIVKTGDTVKITMTNESTNEDHPMHLHGHVFQVLSRNGTPAAGSPVWKDTLNLRPGETYDIALLADNPGNWMFHCHELHHSAMGMMIDFIYEDYQSDYTPGANANNISE